MKRFFLFAVLVVAVLMVVGVVDVWAADATAQTTTTSSSSGSSTNGQIGLVLSKDLYCSTKDLLQGTFGLIIGLVIAFMGLWSLVKGGSVPSALMMIIFGALVTAMPGLVEATFKNISSLLNQDSGTAVEQAAFSNIACTNTTPPTFSLDDMVRYDRRALVGP